MLRRALSGLAACLVTVCPALALASHAPFDELVADLDSLRVEHGVAGFAVTLVSGEHALSYGYGPGLGQSLRKGLHWYGHGGDGDGYLSHFAYNRQADAGYFLTINAFKHGALDAMKARVQDHLAHDLSPPRAPASRTDPESLPALTGTYRKVTRRFAWQDPAGLDADRLQVVLEDGALCTRSASGRRLLIPVEAQLFRRQGQPLATIAIAVQDGERYLQAEFGNYRRVRR